MTFAGFLQELLRFTLQADRGKRITGKALNAVHRNRKDCRHGETGVLRSLLHHGRRNDAARERGKASNDEGLVHEERADEPGERAHAEEAREADDHGLPLLKEALKGKERAHMSNQKEDCNGRAELQDLGVRHHRLREESPEAEKKNDCRNED